MRIFFSRLNGTHRELFNVTGKQCRIGKSPDSNIVLDSPQIKDDEDALTLRRTPDGWLLRVLGLHTCRVGKLELFGGQSLLIEKNETVKLFPYTLELQLPEDLATPEDVIRRQLDEEMSNLMTQVHLDLLKRMDMRLGADPIKDDDENLLNLERNLDEISRLRGVEDQLKQQLCTHIAGHAVRSRILEDLLETSSVQPSELLSTGNWRELLTKAPQLEDELARIVAGIREQLQLQSLRGLSRKIDRIEDHFWDFWATRSRDLLAESRVYLARRYLKKHIKDIVFGYGPLEDLILIPSISEIMVVDSQHIYIERDGQLENSGRRFVSDDVTLTIIERIVSKVGRRIDKSQPLVDARLADGSRVNAVIAPLAVSGPSLTIRKFKEERDSIDELVRKYRSMTQTVADFLRAAVLARKNIVISGGTGTGKTTLLNCVSDFIPNRERIVTIEDTAELRLAKEHVVRMETKHANVEGAGEYTIRDLVKNSLRMRPDRIVVGECRGGEALDMLQAMNTGHDGSLTTIHANSSRDVVLRLEVLVQMAAELPIESIHRQIGSAVDLIVQLRRLRTGRRVVSQITEVIDYDERTRELKMKDLFLLTGSHASFDDCVRALRGLDSEEYEDIMARVRNYGEQTVTHVEQLRDSSSEPELTNQDRKELTELLDFCGLGTRLTATGRLPTFMGELIADESIDLDSFYV